MGSYEISTFKESYTTGGDAAGDANRDGDTTDSWGVLYDPAAGTVTVDLNNNHDFADDAPMKPYKDGYQVGYFGTDNPATDVVERQPFVVQISKDVPMDPYGGSWVGKTADFVNIGVIESEHGTHVAGDHRGERPVRRQDERRGAGRQARLLARLHLVRRLHQRGAHRGHDRPRRQPRCRHRQHVDRRPARAERRQQRARRAVHAPHRHLRRAARDLGRATPVRAPTRSATPAWPTR